MSELFVSYASVDRARTMQIVEAVQGQGFAVWIDQAGIAGGTSYGTEIANALRDAQAVLLVASDASLASKNVRQEIMLAWRYDKPIIPLILHPLVFPDDVAYWLEGSQWIEVLDREPGDWMPKLRQALARHGIGLLASEPEATQAELVAVAMHGNLPAHLPPIIGRTREIDELLALLGNGRIITLTGPGGTGKTRLALEVARRLGPSLPGGAWFVDLSAISAGALVLPEIAMALGIAMAPDQPAIASIVDGVGTGALLLVLDNLEQIANVAEPIGALLDALPDARVLATSRAPVGAPGEWTYAVPQLALPNLAQLPAPSELQENPAVRLFVERATQAKPDFLLNDGNARAIAEICHRLDGLPLAIEIAAARSRLLPPAAMLTRLGSRLSLLTRGSAASARQQTLRDTIAWSYHLLEPDQQQVFRMFGVFAGGASVEALEGVLGVAIAEQRATAGYLSVLDVAEDLIDQALLTIDQDAAAGPRLRMLETIREYALEQVAAHEEDAATGAAHIGYFATWLEEIVPKLESAAAGETIGAIRADLGNVRVALRRSQVEAPSVWRRMVNVLFAYWRIDGPYSEAVDELRQVAATVDDADRIERADALSALGWLTGARGAFREADELFSQALALYEAEGRSGRIADMHYQLAVSAELTGNYEEARRHQLARRAIHAEDGDAGRMARVDHDLGRIASFEGDYETAIGLITSSLAQYRTMGDMHSIAIALYDLATVEMFHGDSGPALAHIDESLALMRTLDDSYMFAIATAARARVQQLGGDFAAAEPTLVEAETLADELSDANVQSMVRYAQGCNALGQESYAEATALFERDLVSAQEREDRWRIAEIYDRLATIAVAAGRAEEAARYLGRAAREREETGGHIPPVNVAEHEGTVESARAALGDARFGELWEEGRAL